MNGQWVDNDELFDAALKRLMLPVNASVQNCYFDVSALGAFPHLWNTQVFQSPREAIFDLLLGQLGIADFLGLDELDLLVWQNANHIGLFC
ncbi:hypothetical protein MYX84_02230 [Acidobacteria bacterium AH-259-O06]|nr:hypothetical protein [Acidobacteria bacterium AH-259-O06]